LHPGDDVFQKGRTDVQRGSLRDDLQTRKNFGGSELVPADCPQQDTNTTMHPVSELLGSQSGGGSRSPDPDPLSPA
jgi:hypothetical protein